MSDRHAFADAAGAILFEKAEPRLAALLAEHGASQPGELPRAVLGEVMRRAVVETAAANLLGPISKRWATAFNLLLIPHSFRRLSG